MSLIQADWYRDSELSKRQLMQRPSFRKMQHVIPLNAWRIANFPPIPIDEPVERLAETAIKYFFGLFKYEGRFLIPLEVLDSHVDKFKGQVFLRADLPPEGSIAEFKKYHNVENYFEVDCVAIENDELHDLKSEVAQASASKHLSSEVVQTDMSAFRDRLDLLKSKGLTVYQKEISIPIVAAALTTLAIRLATLTKLRPLVAGFVPPGLMNSLMLSEAIGISKHPEYDVQDLRNFAVQSQSYTDADLITYLRDNGDFSEFILKAVEDIHEELRKRQHQVCIDTPLSCT